MTIRNLFFRYRGVAKQQQTKISPPHSFVKSRLAPSLVTKRDEKTSSKQRNFTKIAIFMTLADQFKLSSSEKQDKHDKIRNIADVGAHDQYFTRNGV